MKTESKHIIKSISSTIDIKARPHTIWENITNVRLDQYSDPVLFKLLGIPKPLNAEIISAGVGGQRIAYCASGKRFLQSITAWTPPQEYSFDFNPEKGFLVGHFFDLSDGVFRLPGGAYLLIEKASETTLQLSTTYSIGRRIYLLFNWPARLILKAFQGYLLRSI